MTSKEARIPAAPARRAPARAAPGLFACPRPGQPRPPAPVRTQRTRRITRGSRRVAAAVTQSHSQHNEPRSSMTGNRAYTPNGPIEPDSTHM